jgi:ATP-dependent exoDNAse (exonuclease V) beta subunit
LCVTTERPQESDASDSVTLTKTAWMVERITQRFPDATIAVLLRKNLGVAEIKSVLAQVGVAASQEGGNPLSDATSVQIILSAFQWADQPDHGPARFMLACSPLGASMGVTQPFVQPEDFMAASRIRRQLIEQGYGPTVLAWSRILDRHVGEHESRRLHQLVDLAFEYEALATLRPGDFVDFVNTRPVEDPQAAQVRVMTIHQAKGLEFDWVVLPELDDQLIGQPPAFVSWSRRPFDFPTGVIRYVKQSLQGLLPDEIQHAFHHQRVTELRESLCVLYVAITRARQGLMLINRPSPENERSLPQSLAGLLRGSLTDGHPLMPDEAWYQNGPREWLEILHG